MFALRLGCRVKSFPGIIGYRIVGWQPSTELVSQRREAVCERARWAT